MHFNWDYHRKVCGFDVLLSCQNLFMYLPSSFLYSHLAVSPLYKAPVFNIANLSVIIRSLFWAKQFSFCDVHSALHFCSWNRCLQGPYLTTVGQTVVFSYRLNESTYGHVFWSYSDPCRSSVPYKFQVTPIDLHQHDLLISTDPLTSGGWWGWWGSCSSFCFWPWPHGPQASISLWKVRV